MGSGRLVGGFQGFLGPIAMPNGRFVQPGSLMAGGADGWLQPILTSDSSSDCCTPGEIVYDELFPDEHYITTDSVVIPPEECVYEIPIGEFPCGNFRMEITADCAWAGVPTGFSPGATAAFAYLNASGLNTPSRDFSAGTTAATMANIPAIESDNAYRPYTFSVFPTAAPPYTDFSGPVPAQSVYFWSPGVVFPSFATGQWFVKNVHIRITCLP